jgi:hypothetical protein
MVGVRSKREQQLLERLRAAPVADTTTLRAEQALLFGAHTETNGEWNEEEYAARVARCRTAVVDFVESGTYRRVSRRVWLYRMLPWNALLLAWHAVKALVSTVGRLTRA